MNLIPDRWGDFGGSTPVIVPGRLRALIVDDNAYARAIVAATLQMPGIGEITEAEGGAAAIAAADRNLRFHAARLVYARGQRRRPDAGDSGRRSPLPSAKP